MTEFEEVNISQLTLGGIIRLLPSFSGDNGNKVEVQKLNFASLREAVNCKAHTYKTTSDPVNTTYLKQVQLFKKLEKVVSRSSGLIL